jgi:hypothetical protein
MILGRELRKERWMGFPWQLVQHLELGQGFLGGSMVLLE